MQKEAMRVFVDQRERREGQDRTTVVIVSGECKRQDK
jgi:hypothetical protein